MKSERMRTAKKSNSSKSGNANVAWMKQIERREKREKCHLLLFRSRYIEVLSRDSDFPLALAASFRNADCVSLFSCKNVFVLMRVAL